MCDKDNLCEEPKPKTPPRPRKKNQTKSTGKSKNSLCLSNLYIYSIYKRLLVRFGSESMHIFFVVVKSPRQRRDSSTVEDKRYEIEVPKTQNCILYAMQTLPLVTDFLSGEEKLPHISIPTFLAKNMVSDLVIVTIYT